jgi:hypothetical protein
MGTDKFYMCLLKSGLWPYCTLAILLRSLDSEDLLVEFYSVFSLQASA